MVDGSAIFIYVHFVSSIGCGMFAQQHVEEARLGLQPKIFEIHQQRNTPYNSKYFCLIGEPCDISANRDTVLISRVWSCGADL